MTRQGAIRQALIGAHRAGRVQPGPPLHRFREQEAMKSKCPHHVSSACRMVSGVAKGAAPDSAISSVESSSYGKRFSRER